MMHCLYVGRPNVWRTEILRSLSVGRQHCCTNRDDYATSYEEEVALHIELSSCGKKRHRM